MVASMSFSGWRDAIWELEEEDSFVESDSQSKPSTTDHTSKYAMVTSVFIKKTTRVDTHEFRDLPSEKPWNPLQRRKSLFNTETSGIRGRERSLGTEGLMSGTHGYHYRQRYDDHFEFEQLAKQRDFSVEGGDWTIRRGRFVANDSSRGQFVAWTISRRQFVAMLIRRTDNSSHEWSVVSELDFR